MLKRLLPQRPTAPPPAAARQLPNKRFVAPTPEVPLGEELALETPASAETFAGESSEAGYYATAEQPVVEERQAEAAHHEPQYQPEPDHTLMADLGANKNILSRPSNVWGGVLLKLHIFALDQWEP